MVGRRRWQGPLEPFCAVPNPFIANRLARHDGRNDVVEEQQLGGAINKGANRGHHIEVRELERVVRDAPGHTSQTNEVLREESNVEADKRNPEVGFAHRLVVHPSTPLG